MKNEVFEDYTELTAKQFAVMNYRYTMISGIIPIVEDKKKLAAAVKRTAEEYGVSKPTVRSYLKAYLKDRDKRVLAPVVREARDHKLNVIYCHGRNADRIISHIANNLSEQK